MKKAIYISLSPHRHLCLRHPISTSHISRSMRMPLHSWPPDPGSQPMGSMGTSHVLKCPYVESAWRCKRSRSSEPRNLLLASISKTSDYRWNVLALCFTRKVFTNIASCPIFTKREFSFCNPYARNIYKKQALVHLTVSLCLPSLFIPTHPQILHPPTHTHRAT